MNQKTKMIGITVSPEVHRAFRVIAARNDKTISALGSEVIARFINQQKQESTNGQQSQAEPITA